MDLVVSSGPAPVASGGGPHAVKVAGLLVYGYDANGNMTSGAGRTIDYDFENRPTSITSSGTTTTFVYDGDGGRVKKTAGAATTVYIGKLYVCENGSCTKMIFAGSNRVAEKEVSGGVTSYFHPDHLGSTSVVTDSLGNNVEDLAYYPYGDTFLDVGAQDVRFKYTGKEKDDSTGLYFYEARYYDAFLGRFISADTIVPDPLDPQALNRYSYVLNNPILYTDPSGHGFFSFVANIFKGIGKTVVGAFQGDPNAWIQIGIMAASWGAASGVSAVAETAMANFITGGAQWVFTGTQMTSISIAGGLAGGAAAGLTAAVGLKAAGFDANIGNAIGLGALSGGLAGGISAPGALPWAGEIVATGLVGGGIAELAGGNFADGFGFAAITSAVFHYKDIVDLIKELRRPRWEIVGEFADVWPTDHDRITSGYSLGGDGRRRHTAIDIENPLGDPVYSFRDGTVAEVGSAPRSGNYLKVDHAGKIQSSYSHTNSHVEVGQSVTEGQIIGFSDGSGSGEPHTHFVIRDNLNRVNPCTVTSCP